MWVVLEHQLFMWNYMKEDGRDVVEVETPLNERIYGVGLSKPPAGVFNENVRYLLVTVTPSYVLIHQVPPARALSADPPPCSPPRLRCSSLRSQRGRRCG